MYHHGCNDANLLAVALGEVTQILLRTKNLVVHERLEDRQTFAGCLRGETVELSDESEVLLWRIEVDEEASVDRPFVLQQRP